MVKPVLSATQKKTKLGFHDQLSLNADQKYCRMLQWGLEHSAILRSSLSKKFSLRHLFCLFLSDHLRHVLLYLSWTSYTGLGKSV